MSNRIIRHHKSSLTTLFVSSLTILTALSIIFLSSSKVSADSSSAVDISVTVPASCSITTSPGALSTTIQPGGDGKIGDSYIKALCNDAGGLAIYAIGYTGDIHGDNNLRLEESGNTLSSTNLIPTGAAASPTNSQ
ncbi:hypothetical protein IKG06_00105, partial [Candidatus Saccharibacteria bacterium]|nr:hypothetical protein [Candidatus Saccharibacteria bacterium]